MLKINVGFNRKTGEANYGSRGASVNLEIEVESGVVREPDKLQAKIDYLFNLAEASVESQLNGACQPQQPQSAPANGNGNNGTNGNGTHANASQSHNGNGNGNGHSGNGNGHSSQATGNGHRASEKQMNFANQLAKGIRGLRNRKQQALAGRAAAGLVRNECAFDPQPDGQLLVLPAFSPRGYGRLFHLHLPHHGGRGQPRAAGT